jgi:hypothetical protein
VRAQGSGLRPKSALKAPAKAEVHVLCHMYRIIRITAYYTHIILKKARICHVCTNAHTNPNSKGSGPPTAMHMHVISSTSHWANMSAPKHWAKGGNQVALVVAALRGGRVPPAQSTHPGRPLLSLWHTLSNSRGERIPS